MRKGQCPFGADAPHYGLKREAQAAAEELIACESAGFGGDAAGRVWQAFSGSCRVGRVGWVLFLVCAPRVSFGVRAHCVRVCSCGCAPWGCYFRG